jgi:hypothetical protein
LAASLDKGFPYDDWEAVVWMTKDKIKLRFLPLCTIRSEKQFKKGRNEQRLDNGLK